MRTIPLLVTVLVLAGCAHQKSATHELPSGVVLDGYAPQAGIVSDTSAEDEIAARCESSRREQIAFYEKASAADFVAECAKTGRWRFLSCVVMESQFTSLPGLTRAEVERYVDGERIPYECISYWGIVDGMFDGAKKLQSKLHEVRKAYAARVNRAVIAELEKRTTASNTRN